jgi:hypothetical protein
MDTKFTKEDAEKDCGDPALISSDDWWSVEWYSIAIFEVPGDEENHVNQQSDPEDASRKQEEKTSANFPSIEPVNAQIPKEDKQNKCDRPLFV